MTPYELGVLLHYYAHADDHPDLKRQPPIWEITITKFLAQALLVPHFSPDEPDYRITERGSVYVGALEKVPLPVQVWVIPRQEP